MKFCSRALFSRTSSMCEVIVSRGDCDEGIKSASLDKATGERVRGVYGLGYFPGKFFDRMLVRFSFGVSFGSSTLDGLLCWRLNVTDLRRPIVPGVLRIPPLVFDGLAGEFSVVRFIYSQGNTHNMQYHIHIPIIIFILIGPLLGRCQRAGAKSQQLMFKRFQRPYMCWWCLWHINVVESHSGESFMLDGAGTRHFGWCGKGASG